MSSFALTIDGKRVAQEVTPDNPMPAYDAGPVQVGVSLLASAGGTGAWLPITQRGLYQLFAEGDFGGDVIVLEEQSKQDITVAYIRHTLTAKGAVARIWCLAGDTMRARCISGTANGVDCTLTLVTG